MQVVNSELTAAETIRRQVNFVNEIFGSEPDIAINPDSILEDSQRSAIFQETIAQALEKLEPMERRVMELRYLDGEVQSSLATIGEILGRDGQSGAIRKEIVRHIITTAKRKMTRPGKSTELIELLPDEHPSKISYRKYQAVRESLSLR